MADRLLCMLLLLLLLLLLPLLYQACRRPCFSITCTSSLLANLHNTTLQRSNIRYLNNNNKGLEAAQPFKKLPVHACSPLKPQTVILVPCMVSSQFGLCKNTAHENNYH
jgi:hypothetical protein